MVRRRVDVEGVVQGVGFRPYVHRLAAALGLAGRVWNHPTGASAEVEGANSAVRQFLRQLKEAPRPIVVKEIRSRSIPVKGETAFIIVPSTHEAAGGDLPPVPADAALCPRCREELFDPRDRRYRYPFIACTACGPRFSIIENMPYDRAYTTLRKFPLCAPCSQEYADPNHRRFHAEATGCPACGPHLEFWSSDGLMRAQKEVALALAIDALRRGRVVAVKGLGGFQLLVDARNENTVGELRRRKNRHEKPFAVMVGTLREARSLCVISLTEKVLLMSPEAPIVLLEKRPHAAVAPSVAPGNKMLGTMLATTPLHALLLEELKCPLVATSGNRSDEPICIDENEAVARLANIADFFLVHNRPIVRPVDDSVVRDAAGAPLVLRRARGFAPLSLPTAGGKQAVMAVGGHLKNTVTVVQQGRAVLGPHVGDLDNPLAQRTFESTVADIPRLHGIVPSLWVADMHPDYASTRWAAERAGGVVRVQHHHAHFAAVLAEHQTDGPALGVIWDGAGWGTDGTVWGGEFLRGTRSCVDRVGHFRPFPLPGGDAAARDPRRCALGLLYEALGPGALEQDVIHSWFSSKQRELLLRAFQKGIHCPRTSSVGRLFDGVGALLGLTKSVSFEGQAAMVLEQAAVPDSRPFPFRIDGINPWIIDWAPMLEAILAAKKTQISIPHLAGRFHTTLIRAVVDMARRVGEKCVVLGGGCFQNQILLAGAAAALRRAAFVPLTPRWVPPNDGGLSFGQAAVAMAQWEKYNGPTSFKGDFA